MRPTMWLRRLVSAIALVLAAALVYRLGAIWWARLFYPFDLEWMEGGMLVHAWRLAEGRALYSEPDAHWIPYIYSAGYSALLAALSPVFGIGYVPARAVSILGSLAAAAAPGWMTWRHHGDVVPGLLAGAIFLGCYDDVGAYLDIVRADGLAVGLVAWTIVLGFDKDRRLRDLSGLLLFAAFAVKQNFALLGIPMSIGLWARLGWREALRFGLIALVPALVLTGWLQWTTDGRYLKYIVETPALHGMVGKRGFPGAPRELTRALPGAVLLATGFVIVRARASAHWSVVPAMVLAGGILATVNHNLPGLGPRTEIVWATDAGFALMAAAVLGGVAMVARRRPSWRWVYGGGVAVVVLVSGALMRAHVGGFVNVLIVLYWLSCAGAAWAAARWVGAYPGWSGAVPMLILAGQLGFEHYRLDDERFLPREGDIEIGEKFVAALREVDGPILSPYAPWLVYQAGGEPGLHLISIWDVTKKNTPFPGALPAIQQAIRDQEFAAVLDGNRAFKYGLDDAYNGAVSINPTGGFRPQSGYQAFPVRLRFPKSRGAASPGTPSLPGPPAADSTPP